MEVNNLNTNRRAQIGNITIPLLKGEQGYSISRIVRTSGDGGAGTTDTYTVYIDTDPETAIGTFQVVNGTGGDMSKNVYDIDNDDIVDRATGDGNGNEITATYETIENVTALASRVATLEQAGYITKSVADLANYYLKSETYTKQEVNNLCDMIPKFAIEVVSALPTQDISETTIYLLRDDEETQDVYQEYIYVNNTWERIGGQRIDLSNYYQKSETYSKEELNDKLVSVGATAPENGERVWFKKSKNLIRGWQQGFWGTTDGSYNGTRTDYICTYKIPVKPNTTYTYKHGIGETNIYVMQYGKNDNYLSYQLFNNSSQVQITTSENTYYIGIDITQAGQTISPSDMIEGQLEEGPATSYEPYIEKGIYVDEEEWFKKIQFEDVTSKVSVSFVGGSISASDIGSLTAQKFYHIAPHIYIGNIVLTNVTPHYNNDQMQITFEVSGIGKILKCVGSGGNYDRQFASVFDGDNNNIYAYIQKGANASTSNFGATYRCIFITLED